MIQINLTEAEAKTVASWTRHILKGLQEKLKEMPNLRKNAEEVLMEIERTRIKNPKNLLDVISNITDSTIENSARNILENYNKEVKNLEHEINSFIIIEEQIKTQIFSK